MLLELQKWMIQGIRPYDVSFQLREQFSQEITDMLDAKIIERCEKFTKWNTKAFPVAKADGTSCRLVGDWRGSIGF